MTPRRTAAPKPADLPRLLADHFDEDDKRFEAVLAKFEPIDNLVVLGKSIRRWALGVASGLLVAMLALGAQNYLLHQQTNATANQAAASVKNTVTPFEAAILQKLDTLQPPANQ